MFCDCLNFPRWWGGRKKAKPITNPPRSTLWYFYYNQVSIVSNESSFIFVWLSENLSSPFSLALSFLAIAQVTRWVCRLGRHSVHEQLSAAPLNESQGCVSVARVAGFSFSGGESKPPPGLQASIRGPWKDGGLPSYLCLVCPIRRKKTGQNAGQPSPFPLLMLPLPDKWLISNRCLNPAVHWPIHVYF